MPLYGQPSAPTNLFMYGGSDCFSCTTGSYLTLILSLPLHAANCSDPTVPTNGSIEVYQNTTEGAEIFFGCNPGFVPAERMRAVCAADGRWNPDPDGLLCTCKCAYMATA